MGLPLWYFLLFEELHDVAIDPSILHDKMEEASGNTKAGINSSSLPKSKQGVNLTQVEKIFCRYHFTFEASFISAFKPRLHQLHKVQ